jgi:hypothetical protein
MLRPGLTRWLTLIALIFGSFCSSAFMAFAGGGWKQGTLGYVAWALMPYAVLLVIYLASGLRRIHPPVQRALRWTIVLVALLGPLFYVDTLFIHVDAQGAIAMLLFPGIQTGLGLFAILAGLAWQWRISRAAVMSRQAGSGHAPGASVPASASRSRKPILFVLKGASVVFVVIYILISMLQFSDSKTIDTAREVDFFVTQYCKANSQLPTSAKLRERFPGLSRENGWFYFTDDKTWLKVQYPVKWRNSNAIGMPKTSEFTATIYSYNLEYHCETAK